MTDPLFSTSNYNSVTPITSPSAFAKEGTLQTQRTRLATNVVETRSSMHNVILRRGSDHLCHGKAINITYLCVCVVALACVEERGRVQVRACSLAYPACNAYAPHCDVICGPSGATKFADIMS